MLTSPRERLRGRTGLYLILTGPTIPHVDLALAARERALPVLQLREKELPDQELTRLARSLRDVTADSGTIFIVNDRPDIAASVGADGVHLGQTDLDVKSARKIVGPEAIVGLSTHTPEQAHAAGERDVDYIGLGPVFPTPTKIDAERPIGLDGLAEMARVAPPVPKVAIGGLNVTNGRDALDSGADMVAVVSFVCHSCDPIGALDELIEALGPRGSLT